MEPHCVSPYRSSGGESGGRGHASSETAGGQMAGDGGDRERREAEGGGGYEFCTADKLEAVFYLTFNRHRWTNNNLI
ncbi:hypothetical protein EYF80_062464 [Liparis tanakae]|uniref:Uncharacterized protein n=1 Tax=Liparis tanakae TaxID=230148 RepID=A0A4Z2EGE8_9TELE|nr:hypothetical protein EYF80_062464 [Liparis tanakae]